MIKNQILSERTALFSLIVLITVVKGLTVFILNIEPVGDDIGYMRMASSMLETGHMQDGQGNAAFYSSGWPLFLIPFFALFGATAEVAQFVNVVLGSASVLLVFYCAKEILPNWKWALFAAFLWAFYPPAILYAEYISKENLMVPLLLLQLLLLLKFPDTNHKIWTAVALGILFSFELLVGPAVILTGFIIVIVVFGIKYEHNDWRKLNWRAAFLSLLFGIITLAPWLSYTTQEIGKPVLNTNGSFNLYLGNNANSDVKFISIEDTPIGPEWHALRAATGEVKSVEILQEMAINYIIDNPGRTAWLSLRKIAYFWMPPIHEGRDGDTSELESLVRMGWLFYYCVIVALALVTLVFYRKTDRTHRILYGTVFLYCIVHAVAYIIFRYRLPIMPIICILASQGLNYLYIYWRNREKITNPSN